MPLYTLEDVRVYREEHPEATLAEAREALTKAAVDEVRNRYGLGTDWRTQLREEDRYDLLPIMTDEVRRTAAHVYRLLDSPTEASGRMVYVLVRRLCRYARIKEVLP